jgi:HEAT repeat protein
MKWNAARALLAALSITFVRAEPPASTEFVFKGKPLASWLAALEPASSSSAASKIPEAEEAIHAIGPDAISAILRYSRGSRAQRLDVIRHACAVLSPEGDANLADALKDPDPSVREMALEVLPSSATALALDDVLKALADPVRPVHNAALGALVRLAPQRDETVAALIESLQDLSSASDPKESQFTRDDAALALGSLGAKAKSAVPELIRMLDDSNDFTREAAATALWKIDRNPQAIPILIERLENAQDYQTCRRVMKLLGEIGPPAKGAVGILLKRIEDPGVNFVPPGVDLSQMGLEALGRIDPQAAARYRKQNALQPESPKSE